MMNILEYIGDIFQWDSGLSLTVNGQLIDEAGTQYVHYQHKGKSVVYSVAVTDGMAAIPNELLQVPGAFNAYAYVLDESNGKTLVCREFRIVPRPQPPEYIYDPTPVITYPELVQLVEDLTVLKIKLMMVDAMAETLPSGELATATVDDSGDGMTFIFGIPRGKDGKDAVVDPTLSHTGEAADAKATGDALATKANAGWVEGEIERLDKYVNDFIMPAISDKMDKNNPKGFGSLSVNRLDGYPIGNKSVAVGNDTSATKANSFAEGFRTFASGENSHAEGQTTVASGNSAHAEGKSSEASGLYSHAENNSTASGSYSHSEGSGTASGNYSHAEGYQTQGTASGSHAEGSQTEATHEGSHAEGLRTKTGRNYQHVAGRDNVPKANCARITGWGTSSEAKNIEELDTNGNLTLAGKMFVEGGKEVAKQASILSLAGDIDELFENVRGLDATIENLTTGYSLTVNGDITDESGEPLPDVEIIKPPFLKRTGIEFFIVKTGGYDFASADVTNARYAFVCEGEDPDGTTVRTFALYNITGNVTFTWWSA